MRMEGLLPEEGGGRGDDDTSPSNEVRGRLLRSSLYVSFLDDAKVELLLSMLHIIPSSLLFVGQKDAGQELKSMDFLLFLNHFEIKEKQLESTIILREVLFFFGSRIEC